MPRMTSATLPVNPKSRECQSIHARIRHLPACLALPTGLPAPASPVVPRAMGLCSRHLSATLRAKPKLAVSPARPGPAFHAPSSSLFLGRVPTSKPTIGAFAFSAPSAWKVLGQDLPISKFQLKCSLRRHFSPPKRNESLSLSLVYHPLLLFLKKIV